VCFVVHKTTLKLEHAILTTLFLAGAKKPDNNSGDQTTLLHTYYTKAETFVLSKETTKQMRWHKEGKYDSEDSDIISHPMDGEA
jgi:hypothetical protein